MLRRGRGRAARSAGAYELQFSAAGFERRGLDAVGSLQGDGDKPCVAPAGLAALCHEVLKDALEARPLSDSEELGDDAAVWRVGLRFAAELAHVAVEPAAGGGDEVRIRSLF